MTHPIAPTLLTPLLSSAAMRAVMDDRARVQRMLDVEAALARAEGAVGVISAGAAGEIADACRTELYDISILSSAAAESGSVVMPLVHSLTAEVKRHDPRAAGYVHWGATEQDVADSALMLELRAAIDVLVTDMDRATKALIALAGRHRRTMTVARTQMQHALPMPLGLKFAGYGAALGRSRDRLQRLRKDALTLQFGGAAGTLAALGDKGLEVSQRLAALLDLPVPDAPWHSHRDRTAEVASAFAILAGTCGKIARDMALMMQTEIGEMFEPPGPGRTPVSAPAHRRSPNAAAAALSAAMLAPNLAATILAAQIQEHERAAGSWQSEWVTFPALALVTSGALGAVADIVEGLEIDVERMKSNLDRTGGHIMAEAVAFALADKMGKDEAHSLVAGLARDADKAGQPLRDYLDADPRIKAHLTTTDLDVLFLPQNYQGTAQTFLERLVVTAQGRAMRRSDNWPANPPLDTRIAAAKAAAPAQPAPAETAKARPDPGPQHPPGNGAAEDAPPTSDTEASPLMQVLTNPDTEAPAGEAAGDHKQA